MVCRQRLGKSSGGLVRCKTGTSTAADRAAKPGETRGGTETEGGRERDKGVEASGRDLRSAAERGAMRIRKRTPARAADPGPASAALSASASPPPRPPPLQQQQQLPEEGSREEEEEEKRVILVAGVRVQEGDGDRVPAAASKDRCVRTEASLSSLFSSATDDVPKPEPEPQDAGARCSRNDGKRWRCKGAAVPGYLFCDRHVAWSTRKRKPRPKKHKQHQQQHRGVLLAPAAKDEAAASAEGDMPQLVGRGDGDDDDDGFFSGFQKRARVGGPGPAA
ncbi:hypothetical protein GQ55_9G229700 [Panicum hallii var. hallii]|uniref:WRC domain-containing protein n=1 Tax=Panicum hallii var. hallii TaxID=1504633 RepID=A0A2T7C6A0_9POAL|nr:hypothetical protein GQ55_9G229700 [Panicum hallii var. hallii]